MRLHLRAPSPRSRLERERGEERGEGVRVRRVPAGLHVEHRLLDGRPVPPPQVHEAQHVPVLPVVEAAAAQLLQQRCRLRCVAERQREMQQRRQRGAVPQLLRADEPLSLVPRPRDSEARTAPQEEAPRERVALPLRALHELDRLRVPPRPRQVRQPRLPPDRAQHQTAPLRGLLQRRGVLAVRDGQRHRGAGGEDVQLHACRTHAVPHRAGALGHVERVAQLQGGGVRPLAHHDAGGALHGAQDADELSEKCGALHVTGPRELQLPARPHKLAQVVRGLHVRHRLRQQTRQRRLPQAVRQHRGGAGQAFRTASTGRGAGDGGGGGSGVLCRREARVAGAGRESCERATRRARTARLQRRGRRLLHRGLPPFSKGGSDEEERRCRGEVLARIMKATKYTPPQLREEKRSRRKKAARQKKHSF
eukprot:Rhum_TRINITY_DN3381_c0_g2::Rhum_TRINITY_DN3381_c0_g2_i1::g.10501::m.10501